MSARPRASSDSIQRRARYRSGLTSEVIAAAVLLLRGYRILARRFRASTGEIDLIAVRAGRLAFVEVKRRRDDELAASALTPRQRERIRRTADVWVARHPRYVAHERSFDVVFVVPGRWPRHICGAL